jgi:hypothetical protein
MKTAVENQWATVSCAKGTYEIRFFVPLVIVITP